MPATFIPKATEAGVSLLVTLVVGLFSTAHFHGRAQQNAQAELQVEVQRLASQLDRVVDEGTISGALRVMGTLDEPIKQRLLQGRPVDMASRALAVGSDGLLLTDSLGGVLEAWDPGQARSTAPVWAEQPASSTASGPEQARTEVQVVIDAVSLDHSLLLLAPVWAGPTGSVLHQRRIGGLIARLDPGTLRRHLAMSNARITLVAPNGRLVAASTAQGALLRPPSPQEAQASDGLVMLPPGAQGAGASRLTVRHVLAWNSPQMIDPSRGQASPWAIVVTRDLPPIDWINGPQVAPTLGLMGATAFILLLLFRLLQMQRERRAAQEQLQRQSQADAAQARWREQVNRVTLTLQAARHGSAAAQVYLRLMQELLGAARGVVFRIQPHQELHPIAQWACSQPAEPVVMGQGLVGQVAQDRQTLDYAPADSEWPQGRAGSVDPPESVVSGLGQRPACHRMVLPLQHQDGCVGVAELEWLTPPTPQRRERVAELSALLALNLRLLSTPESSNAN